MGPRLVRPEDDDERELPPDLALLAEQLSADAQWLAERYPAAATSDVLPDVLPAAMGLRRRPWGVAAAAAAIFVVGIWSASRWLPAPDEPAIQTAAVPTADAGGALLLDISQPTAAPPAPLRALSGGEQEGVLDLLEEQALPQTSLSI